MALTAKLWDRYRDWALFAVLMLVSTTVLVSRNGPVLRAARAASLAVTAPVEAFGCRQCLNRRAECI